MATVNGKTLMPYSSTIEGGSFKPLPMAGSLMTGYPGPDMAAPGVTPGEENPADGEYIPPSIGINS